MSDPVITSPSGSDEKSTAQSGSAAGDQGSNTAAGGDGRTAEQVRGEMQRKYDKLNTKIDELSAGIKTLTERFGVPQQGQAPAMQAPQRPIQPSQVASPYGAPRPLAQYSAEQLQQALDSPSIPEGQKRLISQELYDREQDRRFDERFLARERQSRVNSIKTQSEEAALKRFPALRDPDSEFSRRVDAALTQQRQELGEFPTDKFDIAVRIADSMGLEVKRAIVPGYTAPSNGERPNEGRDAGPQFDPIEAQKLAKRFEYTLPSDIDKDGKVVRRKFNMDRVKDRSKFYQENEAIARTRGVKVKGQ